MYKIGEKLTIGFKPTKITKSYKNHAKEYKYHETFCNKLTIILRNVNNV